MKYVALKDGSIMTFYDDADYMQYDNVRKNFLKEADTIEELCDEFVFVDFGIISNKEYHFKTLEESKKSNALYDRCYGAIWTSKGLIYVAKMNDKGELELI